MRGILFVVTAPSGAGKTTICDAVLAEDEKLKYSVSATTRSPRTGEVNGRDYFFLSNEEFEQGIEEKRFLEYARVYDYYYGTPREYIEAEMEEGRSIILDIDVQGALLIKKLNYPAVYIYILPPTLKALRARLEGRKTDSPEVIEKRFSQAKEEMEYLEEYDYCIINDDLETAISDLKAVIRAEKCRVARQPDVLKGILQ